MFPRKGQITPLLKKNRGMCVYNSRVRVRVHVCVYVCNVFDQCNKTVRETEKVILFILPTKLLHFAMFKWAYTT